MGKQLFDNNRHLIFSLRKLKVGTASVLIGLAFPVLSQSPVAADSSNADTAKSSVVSEKITDPTTPQQASTLPEIQERSTTQDPNNPAQKEVVDNKQVLDKKLDTKVDTPEVDVKTADNPATEEKNGSLLSTQPANVVQKNSEVNPAPSSQSVEQRQANATKPVLVAEASTPIQQEEPNLEIANYQSVSLVKVDPNSKHSQVVVGLEQAPTDYKDYFVKIIYQDNKDLLLPVSKIQDVTAANCYQVLVDLPHLISYVNGQQKNGFSFEIDKITKKNGVYTDFNSLVEAITKDPKGNYVLGANVSADSIATADSVYLNVDFSGTLKSEDGKQYAIMNLQKPLFKSLSGATISNISLSQVSIIGGQGDIAALTPKATNSTVNHVLVSGNIQTPQSAAGLIYNMSKTNVTNSSFTGNLTVTGNKFQKVGGLVGYMDNNSIVNKSAVDVTITANAYTTNNSIGGLVGQEYSSKIQNSIVKGLLNNTGTPLNHGGGVGGVVGSQYWNGQLINVITYMKVTNGNIVHGDANYTDAPKPQNVYTVIGSASGDAYANTGAIDAKKAQELSQDWQVNLKDLIPQNNALTNSRVNYSHLANYQANRDMAYHNIAKLLPFYDRKTIINYGNTLSLTDKLNKVAIKAVEPLKNSQFVNNTFTNHTDIDNIIIHFSDGTLEKLGATFKKAVANNRINEYQLANGLAYTPFQLVNNVESLVSGIDFSGLNFLSDDMMQHFGLTSSATGTDKYNPLRDLYLADSFQTVKTNIKQELTNILSSTAAADFNNPAIQNYYKDKIEKNKLAIALGLTYLNRLYKVDYGSYNILDLITYSPDFWGKKVNVLDWLIQIGSQDANALAVKTNYQTYATTLSQATGLAKLTDFLEYNRHLFLPQEDNNTWFKSTFKGDIVEVASKEVPNANVKIYERLKENRDGARSYQSYILPLLNCREKTVWLAVNMPTITFGLYNRYVDSTLKETDLSKYQEKLAKFEANLQKYANIWRDYYDTWYRIVDPSVKSKLYTFDVPVWDGYDIPNKGWAGPYDESVAGIMDFFGAVGAWYSPHGYEAYANGAYVRMEVGSVVSDYDTATLTHEMTHNFDGKIYFNGYGRREGYGGESFAQGLLENPWRPDGTDYGLNLAFTWDTPDRDHNASCSRFQNSSDLHSYMHGVFDVTYLLDYVEAQNALQLSDSIKANYYQQVSYNAKDQADEVTKNGIGQALASQLKNIDDLIDNNIVGLGLKGHKANHNSYETISMFTSIYAGIENPNGSMGGLIFKKTAFELLAAAGWEGGFIPYVSNQLKEQAAKDGKAFGDQYIFDTIFKGKYKDYADFKKAMFQERAAKKDLIKPISIQVWGKQYQINTYDDLNTLMKEAVAKDADLVKQGQWTKYAFDVKNAVMKAYTDLTSDFKDSIFKDKITPITQKTSQTVIFEGAGSDTPEKQVANNFTFTGQFNEMQNIKTWTQDKYQYASVKVPVVKGYFANKAVAGGLTVTPEQPNTYDKVVYHKLGSIIAVDENGKAIMGVAPVVYQNDSTNPTKILANMTVPSIPGYTASISVVNPKDLSQDTKIIYHLNAAKASVIFIDNNTNKILKELPLNGKVGEDMNFTPANTQLSDYEKAGYELVSSQIPSTATQYVEGQTPVYEVHLKHGMATTTESEDHTFTVHYTGAGDKTPKDMVQTSTWTRDVTKDKVTGDTVSATDWKSDSHYNPVETPVVTGYVVPKDKVEVVGEVKQEDYTVDVPYSPAGHIIPVDPDGTPILGAEHPPYPNDPNDPSGVTPNIKVPNVSGYTPSTQTVTPNDPTKDTEIVYRADTVEATVTIVDDTEHKTLAVIPLTVDEKTGQVTNFDNVTATLDKFIEQGYEVVSTDLPISMVALGDDAEVTKLKQAWTIHLVHGQETITEKAEHSFTVNYQGAEKKPASNIQVSHWERQVTKDKVTGKVVKETSWTTDDTYHTVDSPVITGYKADKASVDNAVVPEDVMIVVTYHKEANQTPGDNDKPGTTPGQGGDNQGHSGTTPGQGGDNQNQPTSKPTQELKHSSLSSKGAQVVKQEGLKSAKAEKPSLPSTGESHGNYLVDLLGLTLTTLGLASIKLKKKDEK